MTATPPEPDRPFGAGQTPYPGDASAGQPRQAPPVPAQPSSVALAVKLMWVGAALSILSLIYSMTTIGGLKDDIREQLEKNDSSVSQSTVDAAYGITIASLVLFGLVGAFLWAWMAWKNGQGRSWARIVATVFAAFNVLGLLFTLAGGNSEPLSAIASVVSSVLGVVIVVLLWRKESTHFYEATTASRRPY